MRSMEVFLQCSLHLPDALLIAAEAKAFQDGPL